MKIFGTTKEENFLEEEEELGLDTKEDIFQEEENKEVGQIALDVIENEEEFIVIAPIAGVDLDDIDVSLKDGVLTISGERKKPLELYFNGSILRVGENFWGKFSRTIILPENLDLDNVKAVLEKNILIIKILKLKFRGQQIKIEKREY